MKQYTLTKSVALTGYGLHTGAAVSITLHPADVQHGIKFKRSDLSDSPLLPADANKVTATNRGTVIQVGEVSISTIEHLMSAMVAMGITNVLVEVNGPEIPIMDGSALPFVVAIEQAGLTAQDAEADVIVIDEILQFNDEATGASYIILPSDNFEATVVVDYPSKYVGHQTAIFEKHSDYKTTIAPARTFVFMDELLPLVEQGLIKGGNLDSALVIIDEVPTQATLDMLAQKLQQDNLHVSAEGILSNNAIRFPNEPAKHKLLDLIGDLALAGKKIQGKIIATRPGHTSNVALAKFLKKYNQEQLKNIPKYDPTQTPVLDVIEVAKRLPHRYPFLLVDKIMELNEKYVVGIKNVTFNEQFFQGHFPNNPVMPGVLQIEAMAQIGGILALNIVGAEGEWDTYFLKIDETKFKQKVVPGDTIIFRLDLVEPIRRGICIMKGSAYVGNKLVSEALLTAQIVKRITNETTSS